MIRPDGFVARVVAAATDSPPWLRVRVAERLARPLLLLGARPAPSPDAMRTLGAAPTAATQAVDQQTTAGSTRLAASQPNPFGRPEVTPLTVRPSASGAAIEVLHLTHTFPSRGSPIEALRDVSFDVVKGDFVAITGRSGSGKSTLLRIIGGLLTPTTGSVIMDGEPVTRPRRNVGMMFQRPALLPWRSVLDNVLLPVEISGRRRSATRERAMQLLEKVGLAGFHRRLPFELSGGMQQRVALCRALLTQPEVLLMDDPFAELDMLTRVELAKELQLIHFELATTILIVTQSVNEAIVLADKIVVLTPQPGEVLKVRDVHTPKPRTLGFSADHQDLALLSAELRDLLMGEGSSREAPSSPNAG